MFILFSFPPLLSLFPPFLSIRLCMCPVCVHVCVCVRVLLNLLLITSHTWSLSGELLTEEDYQAAGAF